MCMTCPFYRTNLWGNYSDQAWVVPLVPQRFRLGKMALTAGQRLQERRRFPKVQLLPFHSSHFFFLPGNILRMWVLSAALLHGQPHSVFERWPSTCRIFVCLNNRTAANAWDFSQVQLLMHVIAHRGCVYTVEKSALKYNYSNPTDTSTTGLEMLIYEVM